MTTPAQPTRSADTHDVLDAARKWLDQDGRVALATVVGTWGSAPVRVGGQMVIAADGRFEGSVSGGCVEGEVISEAEGILADGKPKTLSFGVEDETAWRVGLPCGGKIKVFLERLESRALPLVTAPSRPAPGAAWSCAPVWRTPAARCSSATPRPTTPFASASRPARANSPRRPRARSSCMRWCRPRILVIGATHIGQMLAQLVMLAGYEVVVIDPRTAFAAEARFPGIRLDTQWPQDAIPKSASTPTRRGGARPCRPHRRRGAQARHALGLLLHRRARLQRNHAKRKERLAAAGFSADEIARIHSPIGINIGAQNPQEIAISIMAEIVLALRGPKQCKPAAAPRD